MGSIVTEKKTLRKVYGPSKTNNLKNLIEYEICDFVKQFVMCDEMCDQ